MGSTTTILLTFTRTLNLSLIIALALNYFIGITPDPANIGMLFLSFFIIPWDQILPYDVTNYFSIPINPYLEMVLPLVLGYFAYNLAFDKSQFLTMGAIYLGLTFWLFTSSSDLDKQARFNIFGF